MERDFYNDDEFEELLREKTDQYKMYPSDGVWKGIYNSLHTGRRKFIAGMSVLITGILFFAGKELLMPGNHSMTAKKTIETLSSSKITADENTDTVSSGSLSLLYSALKIHTTGSRQSNTGEYNKPAADQPVIALATEETVAPPADAIGIAYNPDTEALQLTPATAATVIAIKENANTVIMETGTAENGNTPYSSPAMTPRASTQLANKEIIRKINADDLHISERSEDKSAINWLQQYASYELKAPLKAGTRLSWQAYFSPTMNYRSLSGGSPYPIPKTGLQYVPIANTNYGNPNDYVNHRPALGYEAGGTMLYRLTRNFTLKAGLQFNYSRYNIKAYTSSSSQQATIALNSMYPGYGNPNTITAYSNIQNFGGNYQKDLYNHYYQLSVPVGFEVHILGNERLQFNIAATIQPTYLLNRNSYLLTTDYSDYTKAPSLFRRWNFNGALEAFISYKIGGLRWQIGPQLRYQLLSTYTDQYPISENLKEYGIKIGVTKTIW